MPEEYNYEDTRSDTTRKGYSEKKVQYGDDRRFPLLEMLDAFNPPKKPGLQTGAPTILPGRWDPEAMKSIESFWNGLKSLKVRLSGGKATSGVLTKPGTAPTTFNGQNIRYIESPSGGQVSHKFYTEQGSEYILTKDGFARRIKSPHNNVLGQNSGPIEWNAKTSDAGLHNWNEGTTIFTEGKNGETFNLAFDKLSTGFKRGTYGLVRKGGNKARIMLIDPKTNQWREVMLSDVYPTTVKEGLQADRVLEATYSDVPKLGWHILEKTKNGWHPGSPVVYIEKQGGKMNIIEKFKEGRKIHIKKANRGKFTEYCGGKVTSECIARGKNSSDPSVRKRATFAANARKWKHKFGGRFRKYDNGGNFDWGSTISSGLQMIGGSISKAKEESNWNKEWDKYLKAAQRAVEAKYANATKNLNFYDIAKQMSDNISQQTGSVVNISPEVLRHEQYKAQSNAIANEKDNLLYQMNNLKLQHNLNSPSSNLTDNLISSGGNMIWNILSNMPKRNNDAPAASSTATTSPTTTFSKINVPKINYNPNAMNLSLT